MKKVKDLNYNELVEVVSKMDPEQIIELSKEVGYPVFCRLCMGNLKHKFVLLQDGAAAIILNNKNEILLQKRADNNKWGLPGGCQELGETFEETIIREVKEETNLSVRVKDLKLIKAVSGMARYRVYPNNDVVINNTILYLIDVYDGELNWDEESICLKFYPLNDLPSNIHDEDLIQAYKDFIR